MKAIEVGAFEAKTHLSEILERVRRGQVYVVTKRGTPVAQIIPVKPPGRQRVFGAAKGRIRLSDDFDEPLEDMREYTE